MVSVYIYICIDKRGYYRYGHTMKAKRILDTGN